MKTLVLGDIHGRDCWTDIIRKESPNNVVFLGDMPIFKKLTLSSIEGGIEHWEEHYYNFPNNYLRA